MLGPKNQNEILKLFKEGPVILEKVLIDLDENALNYLPKNNGWTIREIVHHIADGDDLWKTGIRIALGNEGAEFSLQWYMALSQMEWTKKWGYEKRSIDMSMTLLKVNREHSIQLLESVEDGWNKTVQFRNSEGEIEIVTVGFVIQMQADHVVHHVKRIRAILKEISNSSSKSS